MQKITTFLTFNDQAEAAMKLYTSVFKSAKILSTTRYGDAGPGPKGSVMVGTPHGPLSVLNLVQ
jgi:predicted 3-demethylubiquinone-9 3-methyltransferase (glyoxalase superfamily)